MRCNAKSVSGFLTVGVFCRLVFIAGLVATIPTLASATPTVFGRPATVYSTATDPTELVFDSAGYMYAGRNGNMPNHIQRIPPAGGTAVNWGDNTVYDPDGMGYYDDQVYACGSGHVVSAHRSTGVLTEWASLGDRNATTMTVDGEGDFGSPGDVFVGYARLSADIEWIPAATHSPANLVSSDDLYIVRGLLFASSALYCLESSATKGIWQVSMTGVLSRINDEGFEWGTPQDMAYDSDGDSLFVADAGLGTILRIPRTGGAVETIGEGFGDILGLTFGPDGYLYIADAQLDVIYRAAPFVTSADFDFDGDVDGGDFLYWQINDGSPSGLQLWQDQFGNASSSAAATSTTVPEPSSFVLLLAAFTCGLFFSKEKAVGEKTTSIARKYFQS